MSAIVMRMQTAVEQTPSPSIVTFHPNDCSIRCGGCLYRLPLSRATMRNQARIIEELEMMRDVHKDCVQDEITQSYIRKSWREAMLFHHHNTGGRHPDRMVFSV